MRLVHLVPSVAFLRSAAAATTLATLLAGGALAAVPGDSLDFQRTFDAPHRGPLAYAATYRTAGVAHRVAIWRDGDRRIKRRTDDAIESYVVRPVGQAEWSMTVLDLKRHIRTDVDRTNLMRIGYAENWFAQTHALAMPRGAYRLTMLKGTIAGVTPVDACRWYRLEQPQQASTICWSDRLAIPLAIVDASASVVWRVDTVSTKQIPADVFHVVDAGFVRNDANDDIQPD